MNGCKERECPCGMWVNCRMYDIKFKQFYDEEYLNQIHEWYNKSFKIEYIAPEIFPNG